MTIYKRLQKKIKTKLSHPIIDSNHQNHTLLNPSIYSKKTPIKQDESKKPLNDPVVPKKPPQWNTKYCIVSRVLHELEMMPDSEFHHMDMSKIHQSSSLFSCYPFDKFTQYITKVKEHTTTQRDKVKRENKLFQQDKHLFPHPEKYCAANHSGTFIQPKHSWKKLLKINFMNP